MIILVAVIAVLVVGAGAAWAISRADVPGVPPAVTTESARPLPTGPLGVDDVHDVRFDQAVRGYRMSQVDEALARMASELGDKDTEIARLRAAMEKTEAEHRP